MPVTFTLTRDDSNLILEHVPGLDEPIRTRMRFGLAVANGLEFTLSEEHYDSLLSAMITAYSVAPRRMRSRLERILDMIYEQVPEIDEAAEEDEDESDIPFWMLPLMQEIDEAIGRMKGSSEAEIKKVIDEAMSRYNERPLDCFGGWTPRQLQYLAECSIGSPNHPLKLNSNIPIELLQETGILSDCQLLLRMLHEQDGTRITQAGYLNSAFVKQFVNQMAYQDQDYIDSLKERKRLSERNVNNLSFTRSQAMKLGLITANTTRCEITPKGIEYLSNDRAGELFKNLFLAYWDDGGSNKIDSYIDSSTSVFIDNLLLCMFIKHTKQEIQFDDLIEMLANDIAGSNEEDAVYEQGAWRLAACMRIFMPLYTLGLVSFDQKSIPFGPDSLKADRFHPTPLMTAFFNLEC